MSSMTDIGLQGPEALSQPTPPSGNTLSRAVFSDDHFEELVHRFGIHMNEVVWDVSVPMMGDRPVVDDEIIRSGLTTNQRLHLGITSSLAEDELIISLSNLHNSRSDTAVQKIKPPFIGDVESGVFAHSTEHDEYDEFVASLSADGTMNILGFNGDAEPVTLFSGNNPGSDDYYRGIRFLHRMMFIPVMGGPRKPLNPSLS